MASYIKIGQYRDYHDMPLPTTYCILMTTWPPALIWYVAWRLRDMPAPRFSTHTRRYFADGSPISRNYLYTRVALPGGGYRRQCRDYERYFFRAPILLPKLNTSTFLGRAGVWCEARLYYFHALFNASTISPGAGRRQHSQAKWCATGDLF